MAVGVINNITEDVSKALDRYFNKLNIIGYESFCSVNKLLVYIFIEELLNNFRECITEEDYNSISKALNCLYGSCLIPYSQYIDNNHSEIYYSKCHIVTELT